MFVPQVLLSRG